MSSLLLSVRDAAVRYGGLPVFENLSFNIHDGSRIALVGKNGAGKSTLMNIITGAKELDDGERWQEPGVSIGYLEQDIIPRSGQTVFEYIFSEIKEEEKELHAYKVDIVTEALELDPAAQMDRLSGGELRRTGLARALVEEPDILLLDEPTNHLDLDAIEWLETYLKSYRGTLLCVSHDRAFLANVTNRIFWLDRGALKTCPRGFAHFDDWSTMLLEQEERELRNRKALVEQEVEWASRGVKARRKRNMRRVEQVKKLREQLKNDMAAYNRATAKIEIKPLKDIENNSKIVAEFYNSCKTFEDNGTRKIILDKFNLRIQRGDRIGILGRNGSGKTTFLKLLINELKPDQGSVKRRKDLTFSYFDQKRSDLNLNDSLKKVLVPSGGDYIDVMGKHRHVCGYLKDFMFDPARVQEKVSTLSGGQKNRLMLAKVLANPQSCLILDEPTNDLDMDTLDMLEEILSHYTGTLIVVSHDRDFLDQTVTSILAFEGNGKIERCIGGYSDYLEKKKGIAPKESPAESSAPSPAKPAAAAVPTSPPKKPAQKLSYNLERELKQLPDKITKREAEIAAYKEQLGDADFYQRDPDGFHETVKNLEEAEISLERYEIRWLELEEMKAELEG
ncbi:MAG: ATP-binding cassette domain-containing protein [Rhodospirillales bacterium]|nr:ATP-binding cassette domain-containing protein [Rhodospirillales bacterium]